MSVDPKNYIDLSVGQAQPFKKELTKFNTDILFSHIGLAEGPVYKINPNGPQDIRIGNKFIDDLINEFDKPDPYVFQYKTSPGTVAQPVLAPFGSEITTPIRFDNPVQLKAGQINGVATDIPEANVLFFPSTFDANSSPISNFVFKFNVSKLYRANTDNTSTEDKKAQRLDLRCIIHPVSETSDINNYVALVQKSFSELIESDTVLDIPVSIPDSSLDPRGYRVSILKASDDSNSTAIASDVSFLGFDEVRHESYSYPKTATIGYALKATNFRNDIPDYSSLVKGLLVKVPSNYNQPILDNGEVDWRELEVDDTSNGYLLQNNPNQVLTDTNPEIYKGMWDGQFKFDWSQNPVWIVYDLLTNEDHGLGLSEDAIDKFNFYRAAQFCDAVDPNTGKFIGVSAYADGTFRHKPRNSFTSILENQLGLDSSTEIKERRFICDLYVPDLIETMSLISKILASIRAILTTNGNKIQLIVDYPGSIPEHFFNDATMQSIDFTGVRRDELINRVEVVFFDAANNYEREVLLVTDPDLELQKGKTISVELPSCSKRSQAQRYGQYILASFKYQRRKVNFSTTSECDDLEPGSIISISSQVSRLDLGHNGLIQEGSEVGTSNLRLQHLSYPTMSNVVFTSNTLPLVLRHFSNKSNKNELYLLSNTSYSLEATGNTYSGYDYLEVEATQKWNPNIGSFESFTGFESFNNPEVNDLWSLGEIDVSDLYSNSGEKLFRIDTINKDETGSATISATEYVSNVYIDSDTLINYQPVPRKVIANPFVRPAPPKVSLSKNVIVNASGSVVTTIGIAINSPTGAAITQLAVLPPFNSVQILGTSP